MSYDQYHKRKVGNRVLSPETQMMGYGYDPHLSEGSLKPPVFLTSTFVFRTAEDGKDFFDYTSGRREPPPGQGAGLVYSRFNNPNLEVLEDRLALWEGGEMGIVFSSGMAAITTTLLAYLRPNDIVLISQPLYGGTETLIEKQLPNFGIKAIGFSDGCDRTAVNAAADEAIALAKQRGGRVGLIVVETPANPTNSLVGLKLMREVSERIGTQQAGGRPFVAVDNTFSDRCSSGRCRSLGHRDVFADEVRRRALGPGRGRRGRQRVGREGDPAAAQRDRHAVGPEHRLDDHAVDGDAGAAHASRRRTNAARWSRSYLASASEDRERELSSGISRGRRSARYAVFKPSSAWSAGSTFSFSIKWRSRRKRSACSNAAAGDEARREPRWYGDADLASGLDDALRRFHGNAAAARGDGCADPVVRRDRERGRSRRGSGASAGGCVGPAPLYGGACLMRHGPWLGARDA